MVATRRRTRTAQSASTTPSTTVSPMFSAGTSPPSTPQTSNIDENEDELDLPEQKPRKRGATASSKKRALEGDTDEGAATERAPKRRAMQQAAYVEIPLTRTAKTSESNETPRVTRRGKAIAAVPQDTSDSEEEILESDDSGSEFDPEDDAAISDIEDILDDEDEDVLTRNLLRD
ncbi:hypothetical protein NUW54_g12120 [Trametes sanguinea]|uniref:Uncharacterized protein n=1 Tax=Trametes sanguinea TaxID=158606 RepID=A0ACC1N1J2_9APHY|nr:hypothetical protein NUW54_g12120 [Trametes sanguinea]